MEGKLGRLGRKCNYALGGEYTFALLSLTTCAATRCPLYASRFSLKPRDGLSWRLVRLFQFGSEAVEHFSYVDYLGEGGAEIGVGDRFHISGYYKVVLQFRT